MQSANNQFGSGWTWLVVTDKGTLALTNSINQDNPLMPGALVKGTPIIALDLWEHAYYLKYQHNRKSYINAYFECLNWDIISEKYTKIVKRKVTTTKNPI
jgi:Fe-Mn family superoxide dismutase